MKDKVNVDDVELERKEIYSGRSNVSSIEVIAGFADIFGCLNKFSAL